MRPTRERPLGHQRQSVNHINARKNASGRPSVSHSTGLRFNLHSVCGNDSNRAPDMRRFWLRILVHQGSYENKCRKVVSWFSLRQDVSETLLKCGVNDLFFEKKMVRESLKNTRALMAERNYDSNYKFFFSFSRKAESSS